jgi:hypothetical protein
MVGNQPIPQVSNASGQNSHSNTKKVKSLFDSSNQKDENKKSERIQIQSVAEKKVSTN